MSFYICKKQFWNAHYGPVSIFFKSTHAPKSHIYICKKQFQNAHYGPVSNFFLSIHAPKSQN